MHKIKCKGYGFTNPVKKYKFLDKTQQKEAELPMHQMESEQPH